MLNRVGLSVEEATTRRAPYEVEGLLLDQLAQWEAAKRRNGRGSRAEEITIYENPDGEAAPAWVDDLPEEAG